MHWIEGGTLVTDCPYTTGMPMTQCCMPAGHSGACCFDLESSSQGPSGEPFFGPIGPTPPAVAAEKTYFVLRRGSSLSDPMNRAELTELIERGALGIGRFASNAFEFRHGSPSVLILEGKVVVPVVRGVEIPE